MKTWLLSLFSITILSVMVSLILEKNRLYKTVQRILTVLLATTIASPLFSIGNKNFVFQKEESVFLSDYNVSVQNIKTVYLEKKCKERLLLEGFESSVSLTVNYEKGVKILAVNVYLKNYGINEKDENIVKLRKNLAEFCNVKEERVYIYVGKNKITGAKMEGD